MSGGEIYQGQFRAGLETAYNTAAVPTRRLYLAPASGLTPGGSTNRHAVQTGGRAQIRSASPGVSEPGGSFSMAVAPGEVLEFLNIGVDGNPTITTPVGGTTTRLHTYLGGQTLDSMTLQWHDGFRPWQATGVYANTLRVAGEASGANTMSGDLFAAAMTQTALSGTVTDRAPVPSEGWEAQLFIDSVSGADNYGTTLIAAGESVTNWDMPLAGSNNLGRLYTAAKTRAMQAATMGTYEATGSLTFVAKGARSLTEYNDFTAGTQKRLRMRFGETRILEGALYAFLDIDIPIVWMSFDLLGEVAGVRTYQAEYGYLWDVFNIFPLRARVQCDRTAAFA